MAKSDMSMVPSEFVSETGRYKPGHDARHVSQLVAEAKEGGFKVTVVRELSKQLPTDALKAKFAKAVERAKNPPKKAPRTAPVEAGDVESDPTSAPEDEADVEPDVESAPSAPHADEALGYKEGTMKRRGREYPTRTFTDGSVEVNTEVDGSGEWVDAPRPRPQR